MEETSVQATPATEAGQEVTAPSVTTQPAAAPATPPAAQAPDWSSALEKVDPKELRKHPRVAGIVGEMLQRERERTQREVSESATRQTREATEEELLSLLAENDEALKARYPKAHQYLQTVGESRARRGVEEQVARARADVAGQVGRAFAAMPEFGELSEAEREQLSAAVAAKVQAGQHDEVLATFAATAADLVAERRGAKKFEKFKARELAREREALRKEISAELFKSTPQPDLARGRAVAPDAEARRIIQTGSDEEFERWYSATFER